MKAIVANNLNGTKATISFSDGIPGMAPKKVIIAYLLLLIVFLEHGNR
jgi:hypothetical protein